jgi:hypothetical protein
MDDNGTRAELEASQDSGLWSLAWAALRLEKMGLRIRPVTLRKYCSQGRIGRKIAGAWLVTDAELQTLAAMPPATRRAGRPPKS